MNPFEMVVAIVAITAVASVIRAKFGAGGRRWRHHGHHPFTAPVDTAETEQLRADVRALKDRVAVLERLATDSSAALEREFDKLRNEN